MSASSVDTAELPRYRTSTPAGGSARHQGSEPLLGDIPDVLLAPEFIPLHDAGMPSTGAAPDDTVAGPDPAPPRPAALSLVADASPVSGRAERRMERQQARRRQRLLAVTGLLVLVGALAATVAVLGVTR
jgi:hypothetical protein